MRDIEYLQHLGILGPRLVAAHMGWLDVNEIFLMKPSGAHVPRSRFKLAWTVWLSARGQLDSGIGTD